MAEARCITIFDIAREAEVSIATVSRALSDSPNQSSKKQRKVIEIARKYNFRPSLPAGGLNRGKAGSLGIIMPEILHPFYCGVFNTAEIEARSAGYSLVFYRILDDSQGYQAFLDLLIRERPGGVLMTGGLVENSKGPSRFEFIKHLQQYMPVVILGQPVEGIACSCVTVDLAEGARMSVRHLHALGHRRIALLGGDPINRSSSEREAGFVDEMLRFGLPVDDAPRCEGSYAPIDGEAGILKMLRRFPREKRPTAILAVNDMVAIGAMRQLARIGMRVPHDIAIVGCDNHFYSEYTSPPLTTLDLKTEQSAKLAMRYLLDPPELSGSVAMVHRLEPELIIRESCGAKLGRREL
ncbi:MAG: LacI family transcriptional regulator [Oscillospiraceae bacterium]|jgi:DNA-binding LacI/PurR family transcriptional regulator|nr:LacI family transcriptional regulator [Oscillospiraceae bacterium]